MSCLKNGFNIQELIDAAVALETLNVLAGEFGDRKTPVRAVREAYKIVVGDEAECDVKTLSAVLELVSAFNEFDFQSRADEIEREFLRADRKRAALEESF